MVNSVQPLYYNIIKQKVGNNKENKQCIKKHLIVNMAEQYMEQIVKGVICISDVL